jgi:hypothetical protein
MFPRQVIKITLHYTSGEKLPPYLRLPEKAIAYSVAIKGDQRLLEVCLPFSFLDEVIFHVITSLVGFGGIIISLLAKAFFLRDFQLL